MVGGGKKLFLSRHEICNRQDISNGGFVSFCGSLSLYAPMCFNKINDVRRIFIMKKEVLVGVLLALSLLLSSCYPELSVQQYDKLKEDIAALDMERKQLEAEVAALEVELEEIETKNARTLAYVEFLDKLLSVQSSELILSGQFDVSALIDWSANLTSTAEGLSDSDVVYYLELIEPDNESESVAAYYKAIEYCLKKIKKNLK